MCLAVPGKLVSIDGSDTAFRTGRANFGGIVKQINLSYVPEAKLGDYILVHVGFALSVIEEEEAAKVFTYLEEMGELGELQEIPV
jgi:hydrogenase expression/formation protein HypC